MIQSKKILNEDELIQKRLKKCITQVSDAHYILFAPYHRYRLSSCKRNHPSIPV